MYTDEKKASYKYKYAIIVVSVTIIGALIAWFAILNPLYKATAKAGGELTAKRQEYDGLVAKKASLDKLKDREEELKTQAKTVSNALPQSEEIGRLFIQLDTLARTSNGTLRSVDKVTGQVAATSTADLSTTGITKTVYSLPLDLPTYYDLKSFIQNSASALRLFNINDFDITADSDGALTVKLTANSYTRN